MSSTKSPRKAIIVLGMHRSGTSAVAGIMGLLGAKLPARLMPATNYNLLGHYEPREIVAIHDQILASMGTTWAGLEKIPDAWFLSEQSDVFVDRLIEALSLDYAIAPLFVIKDPRMCRLMPLWYRVLDRIDVKPCFAIPFRNPMEVALSLQHRDGLPLAHGYLLWLCHVLDAERYTRTHQRTFFRYQDLLANPRSVIDRAETDFGVAWPQSANSSLGAIKKFLSPRLQTQIAYDRDIDELKDFSPWLRQAHECYEALVESPTERAARRRLDSLQVAFATANTAFTQMFKQHQAVDREKIVTLDHELAERDAKIVVLGKSLGEREAKFVALDQALAKRGREMGILWNAIAERDAKIAILRQSLAKREAELTVLDQALPERDRELGLLREILSDRDVNVAALQSTVSALRASTSWRITAPLRWVITFAAGVKRLPLIIGSRVKTFSPKFHISYAPQHYGAKISLVLITLGRNLPANWKRRISNTLKHRIKLQLANLQHVRLSGDDARRFSTSTPLLVLPRKLLDSWIRKVQSPIDYVLARQVIKESGVFDNEWYRQAAGLGADADPIEHYLKRGWQSDALEPSQNFEGRALYEYYQSAGFNEAPALTFATLRANGWPVYRTLAEAEEVAMSLRSSQMFDVKSYTERVGKLDCLDPTLHYVIVGERLGYAPSADFDPIYYLKRYPDLEASATNLLLHFTSHGSQEGRRPRSVATELVIGEGDLNPKRKTVLLINHQASRTGAPILGYNIALQLRKKYNVVTLLLTGGNLVESFKACSDVVIGPLAYADWHPVEMDYLVAKLLGSYQFRYAIANSIDTRVIMRSLTCALVPVIALIHEFASYLTPPSEMGRALEWATKVIFSARRVSASAVAEYPSLNNRPIHILPQGPSRLPFVSDQVLDREAAALRSAIRPSGSEDALVVLGCGTIYPRKGVDLFVACAAAVAAMKPKRPVRFVWIGHRLPETLDHNYYNNLVRHIARLGLSKNLVLIDEVASLETAYNLTDVFFLSSRLDPLPNVTIDSALRGIPVVCFENASGFADILSSDPMTKSSVVGHLDVRAAAALIVSLATDEAVRRKLGSATRRLAEATFDMEQYAEKLDQLGLEAAQEMIQRRADFETLNADQTFNLDLVAEPDDHLATRDRAIRYFLGRSAAFRIGEQPSTNFYYRRPCTGFHPQIYAYANGDSYDTAVVNPLAHFIRAGKPEGPWKHSVLTPSRISGKANLGKDGFRTALHVHFHYPELYADFQKKIATNESRCDLLLSTNDKRKAENLRHATESYLNGKVVIRIVPNRGRDIGAFLTAFGGEIANDYDIVGHLHSKRSLFIGSPVIGDRWREFLWQNLLGGLYPMIDIILGQFSKDKRLGIIFPDDPHLADWDLNRTIAEQLAKRMDFKGPLPPFFDFPVGTMFWARTSALAPLLNLKLRWSDYPKEPVPIDGTILHAIERILPFVARNGGYHYASTNIPGVSW